MSRLAVTCGLTCPPFNRRLLLDKREPFLFLLHTELDTSFFFLLLIKLINLFQIVLNYVDYEIISLIDIYVYTF